MASLALALPLLPGKTEEWRRWTQEEMAGLRLGEFQAFRKRLGITRQEYSKAASGKKPAADAQANFLLVQSACRGGTAIFH